MNHITFGDVKIRERAVTLEPKSPAVGDVIDERYELIRELGRGGAGAVFEARHVYTRRAVAIKLIRSDTAGVRQSELKARLLREAQALAAARHPGIVDVLDAGVAASGLPFLVLECLEGRTLEGILATRERLSAGDTLALGLELARALGAAHRAGVVHRDVKPGNVFILRDPGGKARIKLVDFGIARIEVASGTRLSKFGALIGTPEYMSPEQLLAKDDVDARSDIYALGVTLFECLTGTVPYSGTYGQVLLQSASAAPTPSVLSVAPSVDPGLARVIDCALAKARDDRFSDMDAFAGALEALGTVSARSLALFGPPPLPTKTPEVSAPPAGGHDYAQKRRSPRAPYVTPVRIVANGLFFDGRSEDISESGILVLCRGECPTAGSLEIRFASPVDGKVVTLLGQIRWVKGSGRTDDAQRALGIEFDEVPEKVRASINRYAEMMEDPAKRDRG